LFDEEVEYHVGCYALKMFNGECQEVCVNENPFSWQNNVLEY
jgi:hypothetical protein